MNLRIVFMKQQGVSGSVVVKALCNKPEGRGFDTDEVIFKFT
jgi:hypothetical protein